MFSQPAVLLLLWLLPLLALLLRHAFKQKQKAANRFFTESMAAKLMPVAGGALISAVFLLLAFLFGIAALAEPRFGAYYEEVAVKGIDVFILLDVSQSMLAEDVVPNRLQRAKSDIEDLLRRTAGNRTGLIIFAGKPMMKVPLTTDQGFFFQILQSVNTNSAPRGGTAIGDAVRLALRSMPPEADRQRVIVLTTDGEDQESMPLEAAEDAAARSVRILTVAMGDPKEGGRIPIRDAVGKVTFLKYNGQEVWTKPEEKTLREMAQLTGGAYIPAGASNYDLGKIYAETVGTAQSKANETERRTLYRHQYQWFLAAAWVCAAMFAWKNRK